MYLPRMNPVSRKKALEVFAGTENAYKLAKKYKIKTAFGTDILFDARVASRQGAHLAKLVRWYTPAEALKMATADNGELMALSGFINPYPGKLGVVEEGALADLLLVDGNPLENMQARRRPRQKLSGHHEGWQQSTKICCPSEDFVNGGDAEGETCRRVGSTRGSENS